MSTDFVLTAHIEEEPGEHDAALHEEPDSHYRCHDGADGQHQARGSCLVHNTDSDDCLDEGVQEVDDAKDQRSNVERFAHVMPSRWSSSFDG